MVEGRYENEGGISYTIAMTRPPLKERCGGTDPVAAWTVDNRSTALAGTMGIDGGGQCQARSAETRRRSVTKRVWSNAWIVAATPAWSIVASGCPSVEKPR